MGSLEENPSVRKPPARRGLSGDGPRPWLAVWMTLFERAIQRAGIPAEEQRDWKAALGHFLLEFHRHPARVAPWEIRDYLFRTGQLGGPVTARSLPVSTRALAFFYTFVVTRPAQAEAARRPFDAPSSPAPATDAPIPASLRPAWARADAALFATLREKLVRGGVTDYCAADWGAVEGRRHQDWSPAVR